MSKKLTDLTTGDVTKCMLWFIIWGVVIIGGILLAGWLLS